MSGFDVWCSGVDKGARFCGMIVGRETRSKSWNKYVKERIKCLFWVDCCVSSCSEGEESWGRCKKSFEVAVWGRCFVFEL